MLLGPFLTALIPGVVILTVTRWFSKKDFSFFIKMLQETLAIIAAIILCYIGLVNMRGFEGFAYGSLGFFLMIFAIISFVIEKKSTRLVD